MNNYTKNPQQDMDTTEIQIARLAYIGALIATLGDGLSAVAAGLTLNALEKSSTKENSQTQTETAEDLQKQIDYLINELKKVKEMMR